MRSWIECSFKDTKRGGFDWHQTKIDWHQTKTTDPVRAEPEPSMVSDRDCYAVVNQRWW